MNDSTEYYVIPTPSLEVIVDRLKQNRIRSAFDNDPAELSTWPALPENRRFGVVYTLDATLERLGELFPKVLWLQTDRQPTRWRIDLCVHGAVTRLLFSDEHWGGYNELGDAALIAASLEPREAQLAALEELFAVPRTAFAAELRMGGLRAFARATGMPLFTPTNQRCLESLLPEGVLDEKIVIPYDELD